MYSYEEALAASTAYFYGDDLAAKVVVDKYLLRDNAGNLLEKDSDDINRRLAKEFARIEKNKFKKPLSEDEIFGYLDRYKYFIPQGSIQYGCGNNHQYISISNCFVAEAPQDSYGGILKTDEQLVQISKRRGGVGIDLSNLRQANAPTKNSSHTSTGIVSWMRRYSNSIREVGQSGRRGALMLTLSVHHPDILEFATIKNNDKEVTGANISVRLSDEFLKAVEDNIDYELRFPINSSNVVGRVSAKYMWDIIIHSAWLRAEPGLLFWDNIVNYNAIDCYEGFNTTATNPCAELPLCEYDSCRLMAINLYSYVKDPFGEYSEFDFDKFINHVVVAQRLMDDVVDLELEKINQILDKIEQDPELDSLKDREYQLWLNVREKCINGRRTGLGITALGDTLAALGINYGSDKSIEFVDYLFRHMKIASYKSSMEMAKELGTFPIWDWSKEKNSKFLLQLKEDDPSLYTKISKFGRRNIGNLTIAPTGTISLLAGTSSGIEPVFMIEPYIRRKKITHDDKNSRIDFKDSSGDEWQEFEVLHPKLRIWMEVTGKTDYKKSPWYGCCAEDLDWSQRVKLQAVAQRHIDHAISSTLNLPENVTEAEVANIYLQAWKHGLKGITVYRKNCRSGVLVEKSMQSDIIYTNAPERPKFLPCRIFYPRQSSTTVGKFVVVVGLLSGKPYEVFAWDETGKTVVPDHIEEATLERVKSRHYRLIKDGKVIIENITELSSVNEASINRMISGSLRHGMDIKYLVKQLKKVGGDLYSISNVMARSLSKLLAGAATGEKCPECGEGLKFSGGCASCVCGFSKC